MSDASWRCLGQALACGKPHDAEGASAVAPAPRVQSVTFMDTAGVFGTPISAVIEDIVMTDPPPARINSGIAYLQARKVP